jgi:aspartate/methionine/tyrosine aminotransferase
MLSNRAKNINPQPMFNILLKSQELEARGQHIIHLEIGDSSPYQNDRIKELIHKNLSSKDSLGYSPSEGEPRLREAFAMHYSNLCNHKFQKDNIVVTPANASISQILTILCDENDRILIPDPGFPSYALASKYNKVIPLVYKLNEFNKYQYDSNEIFSIIDSNPNIKLIILNNPSNPLGVFHDVDTIDSIIDFCAKKNIYVVVDDTYRNLIYKDNYPRIQHHKNIIYIYSLSKDTAAPALRIGCVVGEEIIIKKIGNYNSLFYSCLPKFIQLAAADYLLEDHRYFRNDLRVEMAQRIENVCKILTKEPRITYVKPNAGIYFYLNIAASNLNGEQFANALLNSAGVSVCPGISFGLSGLNYIRICISGNKDDLYVGCEKLISFFDKSFS